VALDTLAQSVVDTLEAVAEAKDVALICDFEETIDVVADRGWLERLLVNLVDNAIKFTPSGGRVTVQVRSDGLAAILGVRDTGAGIPPEWLPSIFDRFWVGPTRTTGQDGAGLGLSLVKWIAEQHAATIHVESRVGGGSLFTVRFPVKGATGWA
jgi:two-component system, OmpR family, phosphate regulon sensor histidine kinase PhoR